MNFNYVWNIEADILLINKTSINNIEVVKQIESFTTNEMNIDHEAMFSIAFELLKIKLTSLETLYPHVIGVINTNSIKLSVNKLNRN